MGADEPLVAANRLLRVIQETSDGEGDGVDRGPSPEMEVETPRPALEEQGSEEDPPAPPLPHGGTAGQGDRGIRRIGRMVNRGRVCLGVDVGTRTVKVVLARQRPSGSRVLAWAMRELSEEGDEGSEEAERVGRTLRELVESLGKGEARRVYAVVSGPEVQLRRILLPRMPEDELKQALRWECKKHFPFPVEEAIFDYQVVGEAREGGGIKLDVLAVAARRQFVKSRLAIFHRAGVDVHGLLAVPFALGHVVGSLIASCGGQHEASDIQHPTSEVDAEEGLAVIDLGATSSRIAFFEPRGGVTLSRDIGVGGDDLTDALSGALGSLRSPEFTDPQRAEALKRRHGIPGYSELEGSGEEDFLSQVSERIRPVLERLLSEIQRSIQYYHTRFGGSPVDRLLLCGGGARLRGLDRYLADGLGIDVGVLDPLRGVEVEGMPPQKGDPALSVAVGLALGSGKEPNLLPDRMKRQRREVVDRVVMRTTAVAAGLVLSTFSLIGALERQQFTHTLRDLDGQWARLQPAVEEDRRTRREIKKVQDLLRDLQGDGTVMLWILKELSHIVPAQVVLSELSVEGTEGPRGVPKRVMLRGRVRGNRLLLESYLMEFTMALERAGFTPPTVLSKQVVESEEGVELAFRLSCGLR